MTSASDSTESGRLVREVIILPNVRPTIAMIVATTVLHIVASAMAGLLAGLGAMSLVLMLERREPPLEPLQPESRLLPVLERIDRAQQLEIERSYIDPALSRMLLERRMCGVRVVGDGTRRRPLRIAAPGEALLARLDATPPMMGAP